MMKKILKILYVVLALLMLPLSLGITGFVVPTQFHETYYGVLPKMYRRLQQTEGKRIVVIGGSAVAFCLRGDLIEQEIDTYTVCPFGLYGAIGTKAMMDLSRVNIQEGDIVLLAPEQGQQAHSLYFNGEFLWEAMDGNFDMLMQVPYENVGSMLEAYPRYMSKKFEYWSTNSTPVPTDIYSASSFNDDLTMTADRPYNEMVKGYDEGALISYAQSVVTKEFVDYANEYAKFVESRGATLLYAFTPVNVMGVENDTTMDDIDAYYDYIDEQFNFEILGSPHSYMMDWGWFYDSNVHVNTAGSVVYTKQLIKDLKLYLEDYSETNIELPEIPLPPEEEGDPNDETGPDGKDAALFEYKETEFGYEITALKAEGKALASIEIPDFYNGKQVYAFDASVFAGNTTITEIYIGKKIRSIKNNSFVNCTKLARIYMHEDIVPRKCEIYEQTFNIVNGTSNNVKVYVPQARFEEYYESYWWKQVGSMLQGY